MPEVIKAVTRLEVQGRFPSDVSPGNTAHRSPDHNCRKQLKILAKYFENNNNFKRIKKGRST